MMRYQICEMELESNIFFPELLWANRGKTKIAFRYFPSHRFEQTGMRWIQHRFANDTDCKAWLSIGKSASGYLLRFPAIADFLLFANCTKISCHPATAVSLDTIRHLFLDQVIPLVLQYHGKIVLHAGAAVLPQGAVAFLGTTGFGKSTLIASLAAKGFPLLTDDCLVLEKWEEEIFGIPSYPCLRLWPENLVSIFGAEAEVADVAHYTEKKRVVLTNGQLPFRSTPAPLRRIYLLSSPEETTRISIVPLAPRQVFIELVKNTFHLDIVDRTWMEREVELFGQITSSPLFFQLNFPRDLAWLPQVQQAILNDLMQ